jgi:hypothetical protein
MPQPRIRISHQNWRGNKQWVARQLEPFFSQASGQTVIIPPKNKIEMYVITISESGVTQVCIILSAIPSKNSQILAEIIVFTAEIPMKSPCRVD